MKTVIEMAREAGLVADANNSGFDSVVAFAELVCADEREACAKVCEKAIASIWEYTPEDVKQASTNVCNNLAAAIRARGQA